MLSHFVLLLFACLLAPAHSNLNGLALTPPMGYRSWEYLGINVTDADMRAVITAISTPLRDQRLPGGGGPISDDTRSLASFGYTNVAVDDGYQATPAVAAREGAINGGFHDKHGTPIIDRVRFPGGLQALSAFAQQSNLTFSW